LKVKIEIPTVTAIELDQYQEIILIPFLKENEVPGMDLAQIVETYLSSELALKFKGKISAKNISVGKEELFKSADYWKEAAAGLKDALFLAGKVRLDEDLRKAFLEKKDIRGENPFVSDKKWAERKNFTLNLQVYLIKAETGEILSDKTYKEVISYADSKQPASFALYELLHRVKLKLFAALLGGQKIEQRYLLSK
jgi:hypothetical protein